MSKISFRVRLTLLFGGLFLVVILGASFAIDRLVSSRIMRNNGEALHSLAFSMSKAIATNLEEREREVRLLASSRTLTDGPLDSPEVRTSLDTTKRTYSYYAWIGIATLDGRIVAASDDMLVGQSAGTRPWFSQGQNSLYIGDIHQAVLLAKSLGQQDASNPLRFVDFASPLYDKNGNIRAVLATHVLWNWVEDIINNLRPASAKTDDIQVFVADYKNAVISPFSAVGTVTLPSAAPDSPNYQIATWPDGIDYQFAAVRVSSRTKTDLGWRIIVRQPLDSAKASVRQLGQIVLELAITALIATIATSYWVARSVSQPVEQLSYGADMIADGDASANLEVTSGAPELRGLAASLKKMTETLLTQQKDLRRLNADLETIVATRTAELRKANEELQEQAEALNRLARTDALTGLANRRAAIEHLHELWELHRRNAIHYSVVLVDIDFFKKVNDTYGHDVGDHALTHVATLLKTHARTTDVVARFGGEEFLVCLPGTDIKGAQVLAEKLRATVADTPMETVGHVTISLGVAECIADDKDEMDAVNRADHALYRAKSEGRNRVAV
jgi:diguanylate cyclase (GGDEF)-like protein